MSPLPEQPSAAFTRVSRRLERKIVDLVSAEIDAADDVETEGEAAAIALSALSSALVRAWLATIRHSVPPERCPREVAKAIREGPWEQVAALTMKERGNV